MKTLRLKKDERKAVKEKWKENPVFAAFYEICKENSRAMLKLEYEPEEVFRAVFDVLDNIKGADGKWEEYIDGLGERMKLQIRAGDESVPDESLWMAVCEVLSISAIVVTLWRGNDIVFYNRCPTALLKEADPSGAKGNKWQIDMLDSVQDERLERLREYSNVYMEDDERISDEITRLIGDETEVEELCAKQTPEEKKVSALQTDEAKKIFKKLRMANILDKNNMPSGLSNTQKATLAIIIATRLNICQVWKEFSHFWGMNINNLKSSYQKSRNVQKIHGFEQRMKDILDA